MIIDYWFGCANRSKVAACAKHFVGDGGTLRGINENNTVVDWDDLLRIHMPGYEEAIKKGVSTIMASYSSLNGVKMHANYDLITTYLKNTLNFTVLLLFLFESTYFSLLKFFCSF